MKSLIYLSLAFFLLSCNNDDKIKINQLSEKIISSDLHRTGINQGIIGKYTNGQIVLDYSSDDMLEIFEQDLMDIYNETKPVSVKVIEINNKDYLRFFNNDETVSTIELFTENNIVYTGKTVCTSKICASGGGCIPDGEYCTKCEKLAEDCVRTTSDLTPNPGG
ncbi:MAG: hypothetical protein Q4G27_11065 [Flavobacteriaceae bacterium]|nr:hypothetical protein [Flavobacteriaceae bacterium]